MIRAFPRHIVESSPETLVEYIALLQTRPSRDLEQYTTQKTTFEATLEEKRLSARLFLDVMLQKWQGQEHAMDPGHPFWKECMRVVEDRLTAVPFDQVHLLCALLLERLDASFAPFAAKLAATHSDQAVQHLRTLLPKAH